MSFLELNNKQKRSFLLFMSRSQSEKIRACVFNVLLNSSIIISPIDRVYLQRHEQILKLLASRRVGLGEKRALVERKGAVIARIFRVVLDYIDQYEAGGGGETSDTDLSSDTEDIVSSPAETNPAESSSCMEFSSGGSPPGISSNQDCGSDISEDSEGSDTFATLPHTSPASQEFDTGNDL